MSILIFGLGMLTGIGLMNLLLMLITWEDEDL